MKEVPPVKDANGTIEHFAAGSVLFREGDLGDCAYIVEAGVVEISTRVHNEPFVLKMAGPGEILGEMAIIDEDLRSATATAVVDSKLRVIHKRQLQERLRHADPVLRALMQLVTKRYRVSVAKLKSADGGQDASGASPSADASGEAFGKFRMEAELRSAIENRGLGILYQPIVDLRSGHVLGFEALVRWAYPNLGSVLPQVFIPLAEETDLIQAIDELVFREAVAAIDRLNRRVGAGRKRFVGVNVSARQLDNERYLDMASATVGRLGLAPQFVKLELTESQIAQDDRAEAWVAEARSLGFGVSLDDFGVGFSSLSQLLRLKVDTLKVDQSFVQNLGRMERSLDVLRSIIALARTMGLAVVAEGIETEAQRSELIRAECPMGQGYLLGKPKRLEDILSQTPLD